MSKPHPDFRIIGAVTLGSPFRIDPDVTLGYPTGRAIRTRKLVIGKGATIRSGSVLYEGSSIGAHFQTGHHVVVREQNKIGKSVWVWSDSVIDYGCRIGNRVRIHTLVYLSQFTIVEDDVFFAPGSMTANDKYPLSDRLSGPTIRRGAVIGMRAVILPGVLIGRYALIGAGSVVTHSIPDYAVAQGTPARVVGDRRKIRR